MNSATQEIRYNAISLIMLALYIVVQFFLFGNLDKPLLSALYNLATIVASVIFTQITGFGDIKKVRKIKEAPTGANPDWYLILHSFGGVTSNGGLLCLVLWLIFAALRAVLGVTGAIMAGLALGFLAMAKVISKARSTLE